MQELLNKIRLKYPEFSPATKKVADYILERYQDVPFNSITTLCKSIGVSASSVIKFCSELGFTQYSDFKHAVTTKIYQQVAVQYNIGASDIHSPYTSDPVDVAMQYDLDNIRQTIANPTNRENISLLFEQIDKASVTYITGFRTSSIFAEYLCLMLRMLGIRAFTILPSFGDYIDKMLMVSTHDTVIALSFMRYATSVVKMLKHFKERKIHITLITDDKLSPAYKYADLSFICATEAQNYVSSYTGCLSLINAIYNRGMARYNRQALENLRNAERCYSDFNTFHREIN